jgi:hypothetical protein
MSELIIMSSSTIDVNLESGWASEFYQIDDWLDYLKSLPTVIDATWHEREWNGGDNPSYTLITFESEAHKNWFVLRWS